MTVGGICESCRTHPISRRSPRRARCARSSPTIADPISTYLNDHLAGSAGALDLLTSLEDAATGDPGFTDALRILRADIEQDRDTLIAVMERVGSEPQTVKQLGGRVGEKALRVKSSERVTGSPALSRLLKTEALALGIEGKAAGWGALRAAGDGRLDEVDFDALIARAHDQRSRLEPHRLGAASAAFSRSPVV